MVNVPGGHRALYLWLVTKALPLNYRNVGLLLFVSEEFLGRWRQAIRRNKLNICMTMETFEKQSWNQSSFPWAGKSHHLFGGIKENLLFSSEKHGKDFWHIERMWGMFSHRDYQHLRPTNIPGVMRRLRDEVINTNSGTLLCLGHELFSKMTDIYRHKEKKIGSNFDTRKSPWKLFQKKEK